MACAPTVQNRKTNPLPVRLEALADTNIEACFLGSCLLSSAALDDYQSQFEPKDFVEPAHQAVWRAVLKLHAAGRKDVDGAQVRSELAKCNELDAIGGPEYLRQVIESVPGASSVAYYADILRDRLFRRSCVDAAQAAIAAVDEGDEPAVILDRLEGRLMEVRGKHCVSGDPQANQHETRDLVTRAFGGVIDAMNGKQPPCLATGLAMLDDKLDGGMWPSELIVVAARPSVGKTSLALGIALYVARDKPVIFVSLEMPPEQIMLRALSSESGIPMHSLRRGYLAKDDFSLLSAAAERLQSSKMWVVSVPSMSPLEVRSQVRRLARKEPPSLVVVDYLQLMHIQHQRTENRNIEVGLLSRMMKSLALELGAPLILVSQLSRAPEGRIDHRPRMSDLRESGAIEQDSDEILLLHREDYYHTGDPEWTPTNHAEINVAKQRNGATGAVTCQFIAQTMTFVGA